MATNGNVTEFTSALLGERYVRIVHESGLPIYVFPKKLTTTYAVFAVNYGSVDNAFSEPGKKPTEVPDGVAHFLEHKLFDNEEGFDSFERFAAVGADANAYTSYNRTAYLFSCTSGFDQALSELLRFVTHPYFTEESVQKEQGIIAQEIREYEDNPWERCFQQLLEGMYHVHPVRKNICGTVESISRITPALLYDCHRLFYDPSNMALVVCGDVTVEEVLRIADRELEKREAVSMVERCEIEEPCGVRDAFCEREMAVSKPIFAIGIKDPFVPENAEERLRRDATMVLLDEILFSHSGEFYNTLFEENIITTNFAGGYSCAGGFGFHSISGESDTPHAVLRRLKEYLGRLHREGLSQEDVERCRRVLYADELRSYDSTDEIAFRLLSFVFEGLDMFSYPQLLSEISKEELEAALGQMMREDFFALSVIRPTEEQKGEVEKYE